MARLVVLNREGSLISHRLAWLRDAGRHGQRYLFRRAMRDVAMWIGYEISKTLPYTSRQVTTPLGTAEEHVLQDAPVLVGVLRAAVPMIEGLADAFPEADIGWVGAFRDYAQADHGSFQITAPYWAMPPLQHKTVVVADPMIASGRSMVRVIERIAQERPQRIIATGLITAAEGVQYLHRRFPEVDVFTAALDDHLDANAYIVPGLGDAGDLAFGPKA